MLYCKRCFSIDTLHLGKKLYTKQTKYTNDEELPTTIMAECGEHRLPSRGMCNYSFMNFVLKHMENNLNPNFI